MRRKKPIFWNYSSCSIKRGKILSAHNSADDLMALWLENDLLEHLGRIFENKSHSKQTQFCLFPDNYYKQAVRNNCFLVNKEPARTLIRSFMRACKKSVTVSITRDDGIRTIVTMTKYEGVNEL